MPNNPPFLQRPTGQRQGGPLIGNLAVRGLSPNFDLGYVENAIRYLGREMVTLVQLADDFRASHGGVMFSVDHFWNLMKQCGDPVLVRLAGQYRNSTFMLRSELEPFLDDRGNIPTPDELLELFEYAQSTNLKMVDRRYEAEDAGRFYREQKAKGNKVVALFSKPRAKALADKYRQTKAKGDRRNEAFRDAFEAYSAHVLEVLERAPSRASIQQAAEGMAQRVRDLGASPDLYANTTQPCRDMMRVFKASLTDKRRNTNNVGLGF